MSKRFVIALLMTVIIVTVGCGNNQITSTEMTDESAVVNTTADSDNSKVESSVSKLPKITVSDEQEDFFAPADLTCVLPKGFKDNGDGEGLYIHKSYPNDISTINHVISDNPEDISQWSADDFITQLEADYYEAYGDHIDIVILQSDNLKVDGRPGIRILMEFEFKGVAYEQLMYAFYNGTESHYLYYFQEKGNKWMDEFIKSGETIHFQNY